MDNTKFRLPMAKIAHRRELPGAGSTKYSVGRLPVLEMVEVPDAGIGLL
jgi:hypothetical protein